MPASGRPREPLKPASSHGWILAIVLVVTASLIPFLPILENGFVNFDDDENFLNNRFYRGFGPAEISWAATTYHVGAYQPLAWVMFELEYLCFGLAPGGYHAVSLAWHAASAVATLGFLKYLITCRYVAITTLDSRVPAMASALAVAIWACHPLRVESVAWASAQSYLPATVFSILSLQTYLYASAGATGVRRSLARTAAWLLFTVAALFKSAAISVPLAFLLLDGLILRRPLFGRGSWRVWAAKVPEAGVMVWLAIQAARARESIAALDREVGSSVIERCISAAHGAMFYLVKTVWPHGLAPLYAKGSQEHWTDVRFAVPALLVFAITLVLWIYRRRAGAVLASWLVYLVLLLPVSGLVRSGPQFASDRYSGLPLLALVPLLAWAIASSLTILRTHLGRYSGAAVFAGFLAMIAWLGSMSWAIAGRWRDSETLWRWALENPDAQSHAVPYVRLSRILLESGRTSEALELVENGVELHPADASLSNHLGLLLTMLRRPREALPHLERAIALDPEYAEAHNNLGGAYSMLGDWDSATYEFRRAVEIWPEYPTARANLSNALRRARSTSEATARP
jgi:hypothetical protein